MFDIRNVIRENLASRRLGKQFVGAMCLKTIENFFDGKIKISGFLKENILFVQPNPSFAKTQIFLKKNEIIERINQAISNYGYRLKIKDIIIK